MAGLGKAFYAVGFWIRETGQALDRLGCRLQGSYFFHEQISRHRTLMNIFDKAPHVHREAFVAPSASLIGDVQVGQGSSICYGCVLRASSLNNSRWYMAKSYRSSPLTMHYECCKVSPSFIRPTASYSTQASDQNPKEKRKDLSTVEDPFDAPTYNIPEKPVTFAEGASYSLVILAGLGIAAVAGYAVFKELIFEPKEYKIFGKALARIQSDSKVKSRIGHPITGYGTESRNRAARQRIPNRVWTDEDGVEHVEVNFYIRGPHGAGKVFSEMFKDNSDRTWKFTSLVVEFLPPNHGHVILESYIPSYTPA